MLCAPFPFISLTLPWNAERVTRSFVGGDGEPCEVDVKGLSVSEAAAPEVVWMDSCSVGQRSGSVQTRSSRLVFLLMDVLFPPVRPAVSWVRCFIHLDSVEETSSLVFRETLPEEVSPNLQLTQLGFDWKKQNISEGEQLVEQSAVSW